MCKELVVKIMFRTMAYLLICICVCVIIAWTVKCLFLVIDLWVHSLVSCKIYGEKSDAGAGFSTNLLSFPLLIIILSLLPTHLSPSPELCDILMMEDIITSLVVGGCNSDPAVDWL
jgi:hypothetical protein